MNEEPNPLPDRACLCGSKDCFYCKGYYKREKLNVKEILRDFLYHEDYEKTANKLMEIIVKIF